MNYKLEISKQFNIWYFAVNKHNGVIIECQQPHIGQAFNYDLE